MEGRETGSIFFNPIKSNQMDFSTSTVEKLKMESQQAIVSTNKPSKIHTFSKKNYSTAITSRFKHTLVVTVAVSVLLQLTSAYPASSSPSPNQVTNHYGDLISYMNQSLITPHSISIDIFDKYYSYKDILVFTGLDSDKLDDLAKAKVTDASSTKQLAKGWVASKFIILDEPSHFHQICNKTSRNRPVHLLHYQNSDRTLKWIRSKNGMNHNLKEFVIPEREMSEHAFFDNLKKSDGDGVDDDDNNPICISGSSRVGNNLFLTNAGRKLNQDNPEVNVVVLKAAKFLKEVQELVETTTEIEKAIGIVLKNQTGMNENVTVELLLDNFDEVEDGDRSIATEILAAIHSPSFKFVRLWVSTTSSKDMLESGLGVLCYDLKSMTEGDQVEFLEGFWARNKMLNEERLSQFAYASLKALQVGLGVKNGSWSDLEDSSLQSLLLAQVYHEEAVKYSAMDRDAPTTVAPNITVDSVTNLYQSLIRKKLQNYKKSRKENGIVNEKQLMDMHNRLALEYLFPGHFEKLKKSLISIEMEEVHKVGLLKPPGSSIQFRHRTIADFLIARFVMDSILNGVEVDELSKFIFEGALECQSVELNQNKGVDHLHYKVQSYEFSHFPIAYFLNTFLTKELPNISNNDSSMMAPSTSVENLKKIAHACVTSDFLPIFKLIDGLKGFDKFETEIFTEELLYLSVESSRLEFIKIVLDLFERHHDFDIAMKAKVIGLAVHRGDFSIVEFLIKEKQLYGMVETMLTRLLLHDLVLHTKHRPSKNIDDKMRLLEMLVGINPELLEQKYSFWERTPLLSEEVHIRLLTGLVKLGADVLVQDQNNDTVLHWSANKRKRLSAEDYHSLVMSIPEEKLRSLVQVIGGWDEDMQTPLSEMVRYVDPLPETLEKFKEVGADFNFVGGEQNYSVLANAIWHGRSMETLKKLIELGANIDWRGNKSQTVLHIAGFYGNLEASKLLMNEYGVNRNVEDEDGLTPLDYAIRSVDFTRKRVAAGLALHERGVKFKNQLSSGGQSQLHVAAEHDNSLSIQLLIQLGVDLNMKDEQGNTPLHLWVTPGHLWVGDHLFITKLFLDNNADPNMLNKEGETPFQSALENGDLDFETFRLLKLSEKGKLRMNASLATSALEVMIKKGTDLSEDEFASLAQEFEDLGANLKYRDYYGNSLLHIAASHGNERAARFLVQKKGADVTLTNEGMESALHSAAKNHFKDAGLKIIKYLIEKGANVDGKDDRGNTFLKYYITHVPRPSPSQFHSLVEFLIEKKHYELFNGVDRRSDGTLYQLALQELKPFAKTMSLLHSKSIGV